MAYTNPSISDFKTRFSRDFPFGSTAATVQDQDITNALNETAARFNPVFFATQDMYTLGFLFLSAHCLVLNLRASSQGITGQYDWALTSKGVGSVSQSMAIPQRILDNPIFSMLTKTTYGAKYLELILPQLVGQVFTSQTFTKP